MLKVKTIFYFAPEQFPGLDKHFNCVHIPLKEPEKPLLDLDDLLVLVQIMIQVMLHDVMYSLEFWVWFYNI